MTDSVSNEIAQINDVMRTDRARYDADPAMQSRLVDLYQAQDAGVHRIPGGRRPSERAKIEEIMRTDRKRYDKDSAMQERYLSLLEAEEPVAPPPRPVTTGSNGDLIPMPTLSDWTKQGNPAADYTNHATVIRETNDILSGMERADRQHFDRTFSLLPRSIQSEALSALIDKRTVPVWPLGEEAMAELAQVPSYAALIKDWGYEAPSKLAVARERLWRVIDRLNDGDARIVFAWLNQLPTSAAMALTRKLAR